MVISSAHMGKRNSSKLWWTSYHLYFFYCSTWVEWKFQMTWHLPGGTSPKLSPLQERMILIISWRALLPLWSVGWAVTAKAKRRRVAHGAACWWPEARGAANRRLEAHGAMSRWSWGRTAPRIRWGSWMGWIVLCVPVGVVVHQMHLQFLLSVFDTLDISAKWLGNRYTRRKN